MTKDSRISSVNDQEIAHFAKDSAHWWDENGPFAPLHRLNPRRLEYIRSQVVEHFDLDDENIFTPFDGLTAIDVGCGGGLVCEPMARLGARVSGIDADQNAIRVANEHAEGSDLQIDYRCAAAEDISDQFDIVLALEIIEHVSHPQEFVDQCLSLCKPGGIVIFSTLNRTPQSWALGIMAAEYVLGWVPKGTHNWKKFVKPSELAKMVRKNGAEVAHIGGLNYDLKSANFVLSDNKIDINYFMCVTK